ncbi:MAG TPA: wax ester/triacylglycerol synthase domain-containing protein [Acidimicrobiales bacterium]|nr:wax ester/triacylglycerol synthase domain-containing protein [Acidimicrobiales bacterium]
MPGAPLTGAEALMWLLDDEPALRSTFVSVSLLDHPADLARLRERLVTAAGQLPVLRQRVVAPAFGLVPPWWADDPDFDVARHVRAERVPAPGALRDVLDLAAARAAAPFDTAHPLWELTVVDGLEDGRGALVAKLHHVLADGVGAVRLSASFLDASPSPDVPQAAPAPGAARGPDAGGRTGAAPPRLPDLAALATDLVAPLAAGAEEVRRAVAGVAAGVAHAARDPNGAAADAWGAARAVARQATMLEPARSPLWAKRAHDHRFEVTSLALGDVRAAGKALGGTVNDVFVTIIAAAAGAYHRAHGAPVDELRVSVPISTRRDHDASRNAWAPARVVVPTGDLRPADRVAEVHRRLNAVKSDPSLGLVDLVATSARLLPRPLLVRLALRGVGTVDFACSNVRGAPFDLWIAGSHLEANYPFGPTAGVAFNATVLSYGESLDLGLNADTGAVEDPAELRACIDAAADEVLGMARRRRRRAPGTPPAGGQLGGNA